MYPITFTSRLSAQTGPIVYRITAQERLKQRLVLTDCAQKPIISAKTATLSLLIDRFSANSILSQRA